MVYKFTKPRSNITQLEIPVPPYSELLVQSFVYNRAPLC